MQQRSINVTVTLNQTKSVWINPGKFYADCLAMSCLECVILYQVGKHSGKLCFSLRKKRTQALEHKPRYFSVVGKKRQMYIAFAGNPWPYLSYSSQRIWKQFFHGIIWVGRAQIIDFLPSLTNHPLHYLYFTNKNNGHIQNSVRDLFCRFQIQEMEMNIKNTP